MKILLLSDIHANETALKKVFDVAYSDSYGAQETWFLGDIVDRGPFSEPTLNWLKEQHEIGKAIFTVGNHETMITGQLKSDEWKTVNELWIEDCHNHRKEIQANSGLWEFAQTNFTRQNLNPKEFELDGTLYVLVHASLTDYAGFYTSIYPWTTEVILPREFTKLLVRCQVKNKPGVMCFGHTHVPTLISAERKQDQSWSIYSQLIIPGETYKLDPEKLWLVNPGAVGQPRDLDTRTAFAILDTTAHTVTFHRAEYDWRSVIRKLAELERNPELVNILWTAQIAPGTPPPWQDHYRIAKDVSDVL
jgi:predicted phosphodiesterase